MSQQRRRQSDEAACAEREHEYARDEMPQLHHTISSARGQTVPPTGPERIATQCDQPRASDILARHDISEDEPNPRPPQPVAEIVVLVPIKPLVKTTDRQHI
jgi:hypothetical protein